MGFHDLAFVSITGEPMPLAAFRGKAVLLVNTASQCGFTPQYKGLQALWEGYKDKDLVVLGVPSNDFGGQEPEGEVKIQEFCEVRYGVDFPLTKKEPVIGPDAHPVYRWIAGVVGEAGAPKWNFHKYLIDPKGEITGVFGSKVAPDSADLKTAIEAALP
ncbi:MAG: glutathione peroxidase [Alphaproteobacteria bacterium]|nr:glutathione peroxidase [Alphaproteobacteria bacterium]